MAPNGVRRGNRQRQTRLEREDHDEGQKKGKRNWRRQITGEWKRWEEVSQDKKEKYLELYVSGGLGRRTEGEEGRDGGKKGKERSRAHPLRATPPSHNPLLLAWVRLSIHRVTQGRLLTRSTVTHTKHTQTIVSNTPGTTRREKLQNKPAINSHYSQLHITITESAHSEHTDTGQF